MFAETVCSHNMQSLFSRVWWRYVVLVSHFPPDHFAVSTPVPLQDEAHIIKNENSQKAKAIRGLHFQAAILLTG